MGRAGKDDLHLRTAPLGALLREAAEPHMARGKAVHFDVAAAAGDERQPVVQRRPEVIHGLRNLVQNAVDFARGEVWIDAAWTDASVTVRISDDGEGYPPHVLGRIGDPFVRSRRDAPSAVERPDYEGMGLGLFIAKTLLERSGAELSFANGADPFLTAEEHPERSGAIVEVIWPRAAIEAAKTDALGRNRQIES
jgi:two-component system sensor histidine kinase RegB